MYIAPLVKIHLFVGLAQLAILEAIVHLVWWAIIYKMELASLAQQLALTATNALHLIIVLFVLQAILILFAQPAQ